MGSKMLSYDEILRFKQPLVQYDAEVPLISSPDVFTQFAADNLDHICTVGGQDTFHGMGWVLYPCHCQQPALRLSSISVMVLYTDYRELQLLR